MMKRYVCAIGLGLLVILGAALVAPAGCAGFSPEQREALLAESQATLDRAVEQRARLEAELAAARLAQDNERIDQAERALSLLNRLEPMLQQGHEAFVASVDETGQINISPAASALGGAIGGPVGMGIALVAPWLVNIVTGLGWFRKHKEASANLAAGKSILDALDRQFVQNPTLNSEANRVWDKIEADITPKAREMTAQMIT
jgi:hypothetical protein